MRTQIPSSRPTQTVTASSRARHVIAGAKQTQRPTLRPPQLRISKRTAMTASSSRGVYIFFMTRDSSSAVRRSSTAAFPVVFFTFRRSAGSVRFGSPGRLSPTQQALKRARSFQTAIRSCLLMNHRTVPFNCMRRRPLIPNFALIVQFALIVKSALLAQFVCRALDIAHWIVNLHTVTFLPSLFRQYVHSLLHLAADAQPRQRLFAPGFFPAAHRFAFTDQQGVNLVLDPRAAIDQLLPLEDQTLPLPHRLIEQDDRGQLVGQRQTHQLENIILVSLHLHVPPAPSFGVAIGDLDGNLQTVAQILNSYERTRRRPVQTAETTVGEFRRPCRCHYR